MIFSRLAKGALFEELRNRVDNNQRCPSLAWIVKHSRLTSERQAEGLLQDMSRDGVITILRMGPYPWVAVKRNTYRGALVDEMYLDPERFDKFTDASTLVVEASPEPIRTRRTTGDDDIDEAVAQVEARFAQPKLPKVETVRETREVGSPRCATPDQGSKATSAPVAAETVSEPVASPLQSVEARHPALKSPITIPAAVAEAMTATPVPEAPVAIVPVLHPSKGKSGRHGRWPVKVVEREERRQMNLHLSPILFEAIKGAAEREGCSAAEFARRALSDKASAKPMPKPRIPAAVMRAYLDDPREFDQFMTDMLLLGVEAMASFKAAA